MKRVFIVTGELSGDRLAAWYLTKRKQQEQNLYVEAVGGNFLQAAGAELHKRFETLNVVGIFEIITHLPSLVRSINDLCNYIAKNNFDEVVVVDFPGFNLRLIKRLASKAKEIVITYLSPPQLWCWGAWRIKKLKKYCSRVIVIYPFEVEWYSKHGLYVEWLGTPVYELLEPYRKASVPKEPLVMLVPGSRLSEIDRLLPLFLQVARLLKKRSPELRFALPRAQSIPSKLLTEIVQKNGLNDIWSEVTLVEGESEKFAFFARSCAALSKPGTVTLELALLSVPTVVAYQTSWITYLIARSLVNISFMSLPNLFVGKKVFQEFIQFGCTSEALEFEIDKLYRSFLTQSCDYSEMMQDLNNIAQVVAQR